jgi:hypothetical protein
MKLRAALNQMGPDVQSGGKLDMKNVKTKKILNLFPNLTPGM